MTRLTASRAFGKEVPHEVATLVTPDPLPFDLQLRSLPDLRMELATAGSPGAPVVILLHGFPDVWSGWHYQIPELAAAGFRVLAPNQRGYGKTDKPKGVAAYDIDQLAADVIALADSENASTFHLVGHDWGGLVAWWVAALFPERVRRLVILNAPHPGAFQGYLLRHPSQLCRSWYIGFFQCPWLPEAVLSARNYALLFRAVRSTSQPGVFDESDRRQFVSAWSQPGALTAMLNYYRAVVRRSPASLKRSVPLPTRILFGRQDPAEEPGLAEVSLRFCSQGSIRWIDEGAHWIQREAAETVTAEIIQTYSS